MKTITSKKRALVATRAGKFFCLEQTFSTTTPSWSDDPFDAKWITPYDPAEFELPKEATYYFENSGRMKYWLQGATMVEVVFDITAHVIGR